MGRVLGRPMEDVRATYTFGRELGRGQFGVTYLATHKATGRRYACKSIAARKLAHKDDVEDVRREVQIMHHLTGHRNIVELRGAYEGRHSPTPAPPAASCSPTSTARSAMAAEGKQQLRSFVEVPRDSHFPIQNLPFGVFRQRGSPGSAPRPAVAIGDFALDLAAMSDAGLFDGPVLANSPCFRQETLNMFLGMGRPAWKEARTTLQKILSADEPVLRDNETLRKKCLVPMSDVEMLLPITVGDYTDFFCSVHHARNCGFIFRGPQTPVNSNWFHLPIGYHGRASSIIIFGTDIIRPRGQGHPTGNSQPYFGPSQKLDFELEMAAIVGPGNELGKPIDINDAEEHIFGLVVMNDWSARDIQAWETIPLGPFLGKSFSTTVSPWIVTLDALKPFACEAPKQEPEPLCYLAEKNHINYDIPVEVWIKPKEQNDPSIVAKSNFKHLYWTLTQQLAHHTVNGCNMRPGDMLATGTLSGPEPDSLGCLLELTWNGQKEISIGNSTRKFLEDGDEVILTACCKGEEYNVGFGTCTGKVLPSSP